MVYIFVIAGAVLGLMLLDGEGILPGMLGGYLLFRVQNAKDKIAELATKVQLLENKLQAIAPGEEAQTTGQVLSQEPAAEAPPVVESPKEPLDALFEPTTGPEKIQEDESLFEPVPGIQQEEEPVFSTPAPGTSSKTRQNEFFNDGAFFQAGIDKVKDFFLGGNLFGRLGVAVLFIGLSFLVKEAIAGGFFPIELRLASAFLIGAVMIFVGWRLTEKRPGYGVTLQGGGIAILYLTIFAGFRLYDLIDAQTAFIFLVVITILGTAIAILQNSQSLAVISLLGGFLAPVITSTGSGNHVALFSYYAVLNAGIFFMAWHKPWRAAHLTGFFSTFAIGSFWGGLSYEPALFNTTEPFLILFFLIYFSIALMYAMRHGLNPKKIVDGTLVFGLPVVAFSIQAVLVEPYEYGLAWSALVMGGCYAITAWFINQRKPELMRTMIEALAGVSLALLSMTIPFALNATWTGAGWALEGAALVWLGIRQQRLLVRLSGLLLTVLASAFFFYGLENTSFETFEAYRLIANPAFMGFLALSLGAFFSAYQIEKNKDRLFTAERWVSYILLAAGVLWWTAAGYEEIRREVSGSLEQQLQLIFVSLSALVMALAGKFYAWRSLQKASMFHLPLLYFFLLLSLFHSHPFVSWGAVAWLVAFCATYAVLYLAEEGAGQRLLGVAHALSLWVFTLLLSIECIEFMEQRFDAFSVWPVFGSFIVPVAVVGLVCSMVSTGLWPVARLTKSYLTTSLIPVIAGIWCFSIFLSLNHAGDPTPLPFLPLVNPLDIGLGFAVFAGLYWYKTISRNVDGFFTPSSRQFLKWGSIVTGFVWMNATIGRTVHHWADVSYGDALLDSSAFQTAISICWTLLALSAMTYAAKRSSRTTWFVSAGLLGIVIVKLLFVDLPNLTTMHRVISFIVVGILLLVIGYLAPDPPKREEPLAQPAES